MNNNDDNKVDKGLEFCYWNLSYRRKFIRTLCFLPFCLILILKVWFSYDNRVLNIIITIFIITTFLLQLAYNYIKWTNGVQK